HSRLWLSRPWVFFVVVLTWSWLCWILAETLGNGIQTPLGAGLGLLGLLGPMLGGIVFTVVTQDSQGRRDYWRRIMDPTRIDARWYAVILLIVPLLMGLTAGLEFLLGGTIEPFVQAIDPLLAQPASILPFVLGIFFLGPFPEELG